MKSEQALGLVSAGSASRPALARMTTLLEHLGPVKASSFHVARRLVRALKAGYAVSHYSALEPCSLILVAVPESTLERVVTDMAAQMPVHRTMIVLLNCVRDSFWPNPLRSAGARVATLNAVEESRDELFIAEGHADTIKAIKKLLVPDRLKLVELEPRAKPAYFAGVHLATHLMVPWLDSAVGSLRLAGFSRGDAMEVSEALVRQVLRSYGNAGIKSLSLKARSQLRRALDRDLGTLESAQPELARLYAEGIRIALGHMNPK